MGETFQIAPGEEALLARHGLTSLAGVFALGRGRRMDKPGLEAWRQRWHLDLQDGQGGSRVVYLKRFMRPPWRRQWQRWMEGRVFSSTAGIEWTNAGDLAAAGIPAVRAIAFGEARVGPLEWCSCILLAGVAGESLERWLPGHVPPVALEQNLPRRRRRLDGLAGLVAAFHEAGFVHRDLYLSHVFIDDETLENAENLPQPLLRKEGRQSGDPPQNENLTRPLPGQEGSVFRLIDLQRVFRPRWRRRRWVVKDLAALDYSTPQERIGHWERLRFLCRYARACHRFGSARTLAELVGAKSARMRRRRPPVPAQRWPGTAGPDHPAASITAP